MKKLGKFLIIICIFFIEIKNVQGDTENYCINPSQETLSKIESGTLKVTYECFGAKGDGKTNDFQAIRLTHDFANKEYVNKGILLTVYGTKGKKYYMSAAGYRTDASGMKNSKGSIKVITNVDWQGSEFVVDDGNTNNQTNMKDTDIEHPLFEITSPMRFAGSFAYSMDKYITEKSLDNCCATKKCKINSKDVESEVWKKFPKITRSTKNIKSFVTFFKNSSSVSKKYKPYYTSSQRWVVEIYNCNSQYIRKGVNSDTGVCQNEMLVVDSNSGDILTDVNWDYDDYSRINIYPIPDETISVKNATFTTRTNNKVYNEQGLRNKYTHRGIRASYTGNVNIFGIEHFLDETYHSSKVNKKYQSISNGNTYYGFIELFHSSYVDIKDTKLAQHTPAHIYKSGKELASS